MTDACTQNFHHGRVEVTKAGGKVTPNKPNTTTTSTTHPLTHLSLQLVALPPASCSWRVIEASQHLLDDSPLLTGLHSTHSGGQLPIPLTLPRHPAYLHIYRAPRLLLLRWPEPITSVLESLDQEPTPNHPQGVRRDHRPPRATTFLLPLEPDQNPKVTRCRRTSAVRNGAKSLRVGLRTSTLTCLRLRSQKANAVCVVVSVAMPATG